MKQAAPPHGLRRFFETASLANYHEDARHRAPCWITTP